MIHNIFVHRIPAPRNFLLIGITILTLLSGCVTTKKTTYLQEYRNSDYTGEYTPPEDYQIKTGDNLHIGVSTPDPTLSSIFNLGGGTSIMTADEASSQLLSYAVQLDGNVVLPYIGEIYVLGKTISEAKIAIETVLIDYVSDAAISVKLINNIISVVGEVNSPGLYPIYKERLNIYQALSLAGDVAEYGNRYEVSIIRRTMEGSIVSEFDLTDKNIIDSEFYYIMPNDVIYVKPMKGKFFALNQFPYDLIFTTISTSITLYLLFMNTILIQR